MDDSQVDRVAKSGVSRCPVDYDHYAADYPSRAPEILRHLRETCPVGYSERYGGFTVLTRYADVAQAAHDDETFSSMRATGSIYEGIMIPPTPHQQGFIEMDPPESVKRRRAMVPLLSPAKVEAQQERIQQLVDEAIDEVVEDGSCDFATEIADRIPAVTAMDILGLPVADWRRYVDFIHKKISSRGLPGAELFYGSASSLVHELRVLIQDRRDDPRDDGLTRMVTTQVDGELLPLDEMVEDVYLFFNAALDTTAALLTNTALYLSEHPDVRERLTADPALLFNAGEEFLRFFSPVPGFARTVTRDAGIAGVPFHAGDRVLLSWAAANRDPQQFEDPEEVNIDRFPNRHQAFGLGAHRCVGSHLARADWRIVTSTLLKRLPDYTIRRNECVRYETIAGVDGWTSMPMRFTPGRRRR